ncbi:hypothetical protein GQ54DRAFT_193160 [Martensiomyces pterosporus]|nr:hypothetical protein GQ54DRAFT_193160 [Martensiomyces pterosporus]
MGIWSAYALGAFELAPRTPKGGSGGLTAPSAPFHASGFQTFTNKHCYSHPSLLANLAEMSVASSNLFALLPDNAEDTEVNVNIAKQAKKKAPAKAAATPAAPAAERARPAERSLKRDYPARGGHRRVAGREAAGGDETVYPTHDKDRSRAAARGGRGRGPARGGRRQFDRHSATGLVDSEKKEKQGWLGDDKATVEDGEKAADEAKKDGEEGAATPAVEEEEEVVKTLEDYLKERASSAVDTERTIRKANDAGVDKNQLKGSVTLDKKEDVFFAPIAAQKSRKQKDRKEKVFVDIEQRFTDEQRRGAFRGGRGGARNERRGGARQARVSVNDERAFPSL